MTSRRASLFWSAIGKATSREQRLAKATIEPLAQQLDLGMQLRYAVPQEQAIAEWNRLREIKVEGTSPAVRKAMADFHEHLAKRNAE